MSSLSEHEEHSSSACSFTDAHSEEAEEDRSLWYSLSTDIQELTINAPDSHTFVVTNKHADMIKQVLAADGSDYIDYVVHKDSLAITIKTNNLKSATKIMKSLKTRIQLIINTLKMIDVVMPDMHT